MERSERIALDPQRIERRTPNAERPMSNEVPPHSEFDLRRWAFDVLQISNSVRIRD
jgi:hypothetical protein